MRQRKTFSDWLTHPFILIVRDEENFKDVRKLRFNYAKLVVLLSFFFAIAFIVCWGSINLYYQIFPREENLRTEQFLELNMRADSLENILKTQEAYYSNIKNILQGNDSPNEKDQKRLRKENVVSVDTKNLDKINKVDSAFRQEFEGTDQQLDISQPVEKQLKHIVFFPPVEGVITKKFDVKAKHSAVDIAAKKDEPIKATADGTVILASWTQDSGNVIGIQHKSQLISFYKHNSVLLKEVGDYVKAGEPVAIIGNSGEQTDGPHLHFEIWYSGDPVNPESFVQF